MADLSDNQLPKLWDKLREGNANENDVQTFVRKIQEIWQVMFKGVQRIAVVQYLDCELMLNRVMSELSTK